MKTEKSFTITWPAGSIFLALAVGIVYGRWYGFGAFALLTLIGTIVENRGQSK